jgi:protein-L-isoaspartate(D-aspartate) O-methyltransferase
MNVSDLYKKSRHEMVENQIKARGIHDKRVLDVFKKIPRHLFVPEEYQAASYEDHPLPIGSGQTISQPYIVALMTEQLALTGIEKVLEIGTGSGYQAAILAQLAAEVHSVERFEVLAKKAGSVLAGLGLTNVLIHVGDGSQGWLADAPYDCIIITAAAPQIPQELLDQLEIKGRLIAPVGSRYRQMLELWTRFPNRFEKEEILPVVFVPLLGKMGWQDVDEI